MLHHVGQRSDGIVGGISRPNNQIDRGEVSFCLKLPNSVNRHGICVLAGGSFTPFGNTRSLNNPLARQTVESGKVFVANYLRWQIVANFMNIHPFNN